MNEQHLALVKKDNSKDAILELKLTGSYDALQDIYRSVLIDLLSVMRREEAKDSNDGALGRSGNEPHRKSIKPSYTNL